MRHTPRSASTSAPPSSVHSPERGSRCTDAVKPTADAPLPVVYLLLNKMKRLHAAGRSALRVFEELRLGGGRVTHQQHVDVAADARVVRKDLAGACEEETGDGLLDVCVREGKHTYPACSRR